MTRCSGAVVEHNETYRVVICSTTTSVVLSHRHCLVVSLTHDVHYQGSPSRERVRTAAFTSAIIVPVCSAIHAQAYPRFTPCVASEAV